MATLEKVQGRTKRFYKLDTSSTSFNVETKSPSQFAFRLEGIKEGDDWFLHLSPEESELIIKYVKGAQDMKDGFPWEGKLVAKD